RVYLILCILSTLRFCLVFFFFFQAEDGIRDPLVTGVQTCALPISGGSRRQAGCAVRSAVTTASFSSGSGEHVAYTRRPPGFTRRSEERRVGKECRSGWRRWTEQEKKIERTRGPAHEK